MTALLSFSIRMFVVDTGRGRMGNRIESIETEFTMCMVEANLTSGSHQGD